MSVILVLWEMVKDPLMKGLTQAKNDLTESINDINDAISLLQSNDTATQLDGLEKLHTELAHLTDSEAWKFMEKSKMKQFVYIDKQLGVLQDLITKAIDDFEQEKSREKNLTIISQKAGRMVLRLPKSGKKNYYSKMALRVLLLLAPAGIIYLLTDYISDRNTLKSDSSELIAPMRSYEFKTLNNSYLIEAESEDRYYSRFNDLYFNTTATTQEKIQLLGDEKIHLKVLMKNSSGHVPLMLSSIQLEVGYKAEAFDWARVDTEVELGLEWNGEFLQIVKPQTAPALQVSLSTNTGTDTLFEVLRKEKSINVFEGKAAWKLNTDGSFADVKELYYWIDSVGRLEVSEPGYVTNGWGRFKVIRTVDDLNAVLTGKTVSSLEVQLKYADLREEVVEIEKTFDLQASYYVHTLDTLLRDRPIGGVLAEYPPNPVELAQQFTQLAGNALTMMGQAPIIDPNGLQLYKDSLKINLGNLEDGQCKTIFKNIDQVLNPDGYMILYVSLKKPANGSYSVSVSSNGEEIEALKVQSLVAPEKSFSYPSSMKWFRTSPVQDSTLNTD